jgi:outer membrane protein assembly factor BamB
VCACDDEKIPLTGTREYVLQGHQDTSSQGGQGRGATLPQAISINAWEQPGYDATHKTPAVIGAKHFYKIWETSLSYKEDTVWKISSPLLLADNRLFILDAGGILYALQATTGALLWKISTTPQGRGGNLNGGMVYADGTLYIGTTFSEVIACDGGSGRILWRRRLEAPACGGLTAAEGRLFVLLGNNTLEVLDPHTGISLWTHKGLMEDAKMIGNAACTVAQGIVVVPYSSGELFALHAETGDVLWEESLTKLASADLFKLFPHIRACPVAFQGSVYAVGYSGLTASFDIRTGAHHWEYEVGGTETPCVTEDSLVLVSSDGLCVCLDRENGFMRWSSPLPIAKERSISVWKGPLMVDSLFLVSHPEGLLVFLSPRDGHIVRQYIVKEPIATFPLIVNETFFIVTKNGKVQAYR